MLIKRLDLSYAILFDYDFSNSFPSIVKRIIETAQKVCDAYPTLLPPLKSIKCDYVSDERHRTVGCHDF